MKNLRFFLWAILILGISLLISSQTFSYFSDTAAILGNVFSAGTWEKIFDLFTPEASLEETQKVLEENPADLYFLLSGDLSKTFSKTDFEKALQEAGVEVGDVEVLSGPTITDGAHEWAEAEVKIFLKDKTSQNFLIVFHKEGEEWRIFGTKGL